MHFNFSVYLYYCHIPRRRVLTLAVNKKYMNIYAHLVSLLTLCGLTRQKTNQGGLGLSGSVHEEAHPCFPNFI